MVSRILTICICLVLTLHLEAQTENRKLLAHYPLQGDLLDLTDQQNPLTISEIEVRDTGLYSDGANSFSDTANNIQGFFPDLDLDDLAFSLEFLIDSIPDDGFSRAVIVGGSGGRWLSIRYNQTTGLLFFGYNNSFQAVDRFDFEFGIWYEALITYERSKQLGRMFINGNEVASAIFDLTHGNDRNFTLNCFCGPHPMRGLWKNFRVYGPDSLNMIADPLSIQCNSSRDASSNEAPDGAISVEITDGEGPYSLDVVRNADTIRTLIVEGSITIDSLAAGQYDIIVTDQLGSVISCSSSVPVFSPPALQLDCQVERHPFDSTSSDGSILFKVEGGQPGYSLSLTTLTGSQQFALDSHMLRLDGLGIGTYYAQVMDNRDSIQDCTIDLVPPRTHLELLSYYPMTSGLRDSLQTHSDLTVVNVPLVENEGLFGAGLYDQDTFNQIRTTLWDMDVHDFYMSMEVKLDSITDDPTGDKRTLFVAGQGWRWVSPVIYQSSQTFGLNYNNWNEVDGQDVKFEYDQWYEIAVSYDTTSHILKMYVDRQEILRDTVILDTNNDRSFVLWCNCGPRPMRGYWRNLKVYAPSEMTTPTEEISGRIDLVLYPNPVQDQIRIKSIPEILKNINNKIEIFSSTGIIVREIPIPNDSTNIEIDTSTWTSGMYFIRIGNWSRSVVKF